MIEDPSDHIIYDLKEELARMEGRQCELVSQRDEAWEQRGILLHALKETRPMLNYFHEHEGCPYTLRLVDDAINQATLTP